MNLVKLLQNIKPGRSPFVMIAVTTLACIAASIYCLSSGQLIIFQNIFYVPIIMACIYYAKKGFVFSVVLSFGYLFLVVIFAKDSTVIIEALARTFVFAGVAGIIAFLSLSRKRMEIALKGEKNRALHYHNTIGTMLLSLDVNGQVSYVNKKGCEILEYDEKDIIGKDWFVNFLPERMRKDIRTIFTGIVSGEIKHLKHAGDYTVLSKSGKEKVILWHNSVTRDDRGRITGTLSSGEDVTERRQAEDALRESREQLRALTIHLLEVREDERTQIANEMHDELAQAITGLKMDISWLKRRLWGIEDTPQSIIERIDSVLTLTDAIIQSTRELISKLRPSMLDDIGLVAALKWQIKVFRERTGIKCTFIREFDEHALKREQATALFRITQECLTNITRHTDATEVKIHLMRTGTEIRMSMHDNGRGITEQEINSPISFGLIGMKERVRSFKGELSITGNQGDGTTVLVTMPIA